VTTEDQPIRARSVSDGAKPPHWGPEENGTPQRELTPSLVARLPAGNTEAGALLDELYRQTMTRFCWGYLGNVEEAEDAVQDVFYKVLSSTFALMLPVG